MSNNAANGFLSVCLVSSPFWCQAIQIISTTASSIAAITGAIIGCVTLYRMWRQYRKTS